jgi:hypothetical protein
MPNTPTYATSDKEDNDYKPQIKKRRLIEEPSLFRDIAGYLDDGRDEEGNEVSIEAPCPICGRVLKLPEAVMPQQCAELETEALVVLPCGHMFGAECLAAHLRLTDQMAAQHPRDEQHPDRFARCCPLCRLLLEYQYCGHNLRFRPFDPRRPRREQVPLTIPEGGRLLEFCRSCDLRHCRIEIEHFCEAVLPNVECHRYPHPDRINPEQVSVVRSRLLDLLWDTIRWQAHGILDW